MPKSSFIRLTGRKSGKHVYLLNSVIQTFGPDPNNHDDTRVVVAVVNYVGEVIVTDSPDEIAEALGLKEQTA